MSLQDQLVEIIEQIQYLKVESTLILGAIILLIAGLIKNSGFVIKLIYGLTLVVAFYFNINTPVVSEVFSESILINSASISFSSLFLFVGLVLLVFKRDSKHATEFYFFVLSILVGSIFVMKANSFLLIFIAVELTSFTAYILTNFSFQKRSHEAGIKYLLFGAVSSAIMLLGFGVLYGSLDVFFLSNLSLNQGSALLDGVGLLLVVAGLLFKASIVPLHIWVPATYQEAPCDATAIMSITPKLAALVLLGRIFMNVTSEHWLQTSCLILGMATVILGVFSALRPINARRVISLGAIAHSGFLLPFVLIQSETAAQSFVWYATVYALMNLAIFYFTDEFERNGIRQFDDYAGIGGRLGLIAVSVVLVLISLVGLPPLSGFTAKLLLFTSLWEQYLISENGMYAAYLVVAVFATVVSLFFYLKIPYQMFLVKTETSRSIEFSVSTKFLATLFSIVLLLLFFVPQTLTVMQELLSKITP